MIEDIKHATRVVGESRTYLVPEDGRRRRGQPRRAWWNGLDWEIAKEREWRQGAYWGRPLPMDYEVYIKKVYSDN